MKKPLMAAILAISAGALSLPLTAGEVVDTAAVKSVAVSEKVNVSGSNQVVAHRTGYHHHHHHHYHRGHGYYHRHHHHYRHPYHRHNYHHGWHRHYYR